ncbi:MAG: 50S ribosomal protein L19 [Candidatus Bathyarchaeota archaeon]|nr:50S ribosomal protein L19 [Candidatus Bathyarchaeota archaeon]
MNLYKLGELKNNLQNMKPGDTVRVFEKIKGKSKKKSQAFEGIVISQKHGKGINATFTVRAILDGVGLEKTYPLHSPLIEKIEVVKKGRAKRAKLYYLRRKSEKEVRKKTRAQSVQNEGPQEQKSKTENAPKEETRDQLQKTEKKEVKIPEKTDKVRNQKD